MQNEHMVAIVSFEGAIQREVRRVREALKVGDLSSFAVDVKAFGRVNDGTVKIEYAVSENEYGGGKVKGSNLSEVLAEFLRRHGWDKLNAPKALGYEKVPSEDTDIQF